MFETYLDGSDMGARKPHVPFFTYSPTNYGTWNGKSGSKHRLGTCFFLTSDNVTDFSVDYLVCGAARPDIGCLSALSPNDAAVIQNGAEVPLVVLEHVARKIRHVIIPAYDSETYLVWCTNQSFEEQERAG